MNALKDGIVVSAAWTSVDAWVAGTIEHLPLLVMAMTAVLLPFRLAHVVMQIWDWIEGRRVGAKEKV